MPQTGVSLHWSCFFYSQNMIKTYVFIQPLNLLHVNVISHSHTYTDLHTSCLSPLTLSCSLPIGRGLHGNLPITCNVAFPFYFQSSPKGITKRRSFIQSAIVLFFKPIISFSTTSWFILTVWDRLLLPFKDNWFTTWKFYSILKHRYLVCICNKSCLYTAIKIQGSITKYKWRKTFKHVSLSKKYSKAVWYKTE